MRQFELQVHQLYGKADEIQPEELTAASPACVDPLCMLLSDAWDSLRESLRERLNSLLVSTGTRSRVVQSSYFNLFHQGFISLAVQNFKNFAILLHRLVILLCWYYEKQTFTEILLA